MVRNYSKNPKLSSVLAGEAFPQRREIKEKEPDC
jgi:hypothetical protein